jgi:serine/threonine protein kinase/class 3 adenylate cyclase
MSLDDYRLLAQVGAGADGVAYRALAPGGEAIVEVRELSRARAAPGRWNELAPRLRLAQQIEHPGVMRVLELGLDAEPAYAVLEWIGTDTLASAAARGSFTSQHEAVLLTRVIAGALAAAHRLGLSHGRLSAATMLMASGGRPKLDFTGALAGFPAGSEPLPRRSAGFHEPVAPAAWAADRADDLHDLGALVVWLLTGRDEPGQKLGGAGREDGTALENLARKLLTSAPPDRPSAQEVCQQLALLGDSLATTGDWSASAQAAAPARLPDTLRTDREAGAGTTLILDASCPRLGRYRLLEKLGEGAQGVVFRALDPADGSTVAIKILRAEKAANPQILRRFRKEARLMAEANNPRVVNLLEYNEDDGIPYLVLEFVAGFSLAEILSRQGRLEERAALAFMAEVAGGLSPAHERGIVHRDIKPSNILLLSPPQEASGVPAEPRTWASASEREATWQLSPDETVVLPRPEAATAAEEQAARRIKVSDFGLARHVVDSESLAMTAAGALLGTPHYMAPEQWTGRSVDARTDVYAMGATLFHLLAGRPPFDALTVDALAAQHCNEPPPRLSALNPDASDGTVRLLERALAKRPEDRFHDAGAVLRALEALLHGQPSDLALHPRLPECDAGRILRFEFRWDLESAPRQLWPHVTSTDRLDRAIGFPTVRYTNRFEPGRGVRTFIEGRKAGEFESGEQHPYEWVEPHRMGVVREYSRGPFKWLVSVVELVPRAGAGTTLVHRLELEPRSWRIRVGSRFGVGIGLRKRLEAVYRRIDATVQAQATGGGAMAVDPFEEPPRLAGSKSARLERLLNRLVEQGVDSTVVERLGEYLARGASQDIARIRPLALAERFQLDPNQVVAACLYGVREGLLELHWDLLCPLCRTSSQVIDTLRAIREHGRCEACNLDFRLDFANSVELIFRAHPEVREADLGTYCVGGPAHSPHVFAQIRVAPFERIELELDLPEGSYRLRGPQLPRAVDFHVSAAATMRRWEIELAAPADLEAAGTLRPGGQVLVLKNRHDRELLVRIERTVSRGDALTAARAASLALFRALFPGEVLAPGQLATVSTATFLLTALDPSQADALYQELGDAGAFGVLHAHFERLSSAIRQGGGAVVKTLGEGVLAVFSDVAAAARTALELPDHLAASDTIRSLRLRVAIHRGTTLAATLNDHLDYFGATTRQAAAILAFARGNELVLTQTVAADPEVAAMLAARGIEGEYVPTHLESQPHVIRVPLETAAPAAHRAAAPASG